MTAAQYGDGDARHRPADDIEVTLEPGSAHTRARHLKRPDLAASVPSGHCNNAHKAVGRSSLR